MQNSYNDGAFLLAMAIADGALFGFESMSDLWRQKIPMGEEELQLRWNESVQDQPILRAITPDGVIEEPMSKSQFMRIHKSTLLNAGYFSNCSIHAIRRNLGKK